MSNEKRLVFAALIYTLCLAIMGLVYPSANRSTNHDETNFASLAVSLAERGSYQATTLPDHLMPTQEHFAANPSLFPYSSALAVRLFGVARWSVRLPSLVFFAGGFLCLVACGAWLNFTGLQKLGVLGSYLGSPWFLQPAVIGRPEMLSVFLCYGAALLIAGGCKYVRHAPVFICLAAAALVLAVWNDPLFVGVAALPLLLGIHFGLDTRSPRLWTAFIAGAVLATLALFLGFVYPYLNAWREQFPRNATTYSSRAAHLYGPLLQMVVQRVLEFKARASANGWPFLAWYTACAGWFCCCRISRAGWAGLLLTAMFQVGVDLKTPTYFYTIIQLAAAVPLLLCLVEPRSDGKLPARGIRWLGGLWVIGWLVHPWLVFWPWPEARAYAATENSFRRELARVHPPTRIVTGPLEAAFPAWQSGLRYLAPTPGFFEEDPYVKTVYAAEVQAQAGSIDLPPQK